MTVLASLGIDPGKDGGACLLGPDGSTCLAAWSWKRLGRAKMRSGRFAWRITSAAGNETLAPTMSSVGAFIAYTCPADRFVLTVEGLFGRGETLRLLAESAASIYSPLELSAANDLTEKVAGRHEWRPRSTTWRTDILGISESQFGAEASELHALQTVPLWCSGLGELTANPHTVEAAAIARWGWLKWAHRERLRRRTG